MRSKLAARALVDREKPKTSLPQVDSLDGRGRSDWAVKMFLFT